LGAPPISPDVTDRRVPITEHYTNYSPPWWVRPTVERLLSSVSAWSSGISAVVLTNAEVTRKFGRRMRRTRRYDVLGRYHRQWQSEPAWIELVVDSIVDGIPPNARWLQLARDIQIGRVLFHEIGHHLADTVGAAARAGEPAAEAWRKRLGRRHFRKCYWYLRPFLPALLFVARRMATLAKRIARN
jgi:hypothetical protein